MRPQSRAASRPVAKGPKRKALQRSGPPNASASAIDAEEQRAAILRGTLADFFARSPLRGSGLKLPSRRAKYQNGRHRLY